MKKSENEKKYIKFKLEGILDCKIKFKKEYKDYDSKKTIKSYFLKKFNNDKEYMQIIKKYDPMIKRVKQLHSTKSKLESWKFESIEIFYDYYEEIENKCCYCGIEESDLKKYFNENNEQYKNARKRGKVLELERIVTAPKEQNIYSKENCALACYICNNAKSDFISVEDFKPIARGINKFWEDELKTKVKFPEKSNIWKK